MTDIVVLVSTNTGLAAHVGKPSRHGKTVTGRRGRTLSGGTS